jgi:uncharacterized repeat protein (TIGR01451 family)
VLRDEFPPGLVHKADQRAIERGLGKDLEPGQSERVLIVLQAVQPGLLCHTVRVTADGGYTTAAQGCVTATGSGPTTPPLSPSPPSGGVLPVSIRIVTPQAAALGQAADFAVEVANTGRQALTEVEVRYYFDPALEAREAGETLYAQSDGSVSWRIPILAADQARSVRIRCLCLEARPQACLRVAVTAREGGQAEQTRCVAIGQAVAPGPGTLPGPGPGTAPGASGLQMAVTALTEPIAAGRELTYVVAITNTGPVAQSDVRLTVTLPPELIPARLGITGPTLDPDGTPIAVPLDVQGQSVQFGPLPQLAPKQAARYRVRAQAKSVSRDTEVTVVASVTARSLRSPLLEQRRSTIIAK